MNRRTVSLVALGVAFLLVLWLAPDIMLVVFAGILAAVFLRGSGNWVAGRLGLREGLGLAIFCVALAVLAVVFFAFAGTALANQVQKLIASFPEALKAIQGYIDQHEWMQDAIDRIDLKSLVPSGSGATSTLTTTFGALGNIVVIAFVGLYGAVSPQVYVRGLTALFAPSLRPRAREMIFEAGVALRGWLKAQFVSMSVIGVLTWIGLWALGIPLAPILSVLAALLTFIPNIGPIIAAVPAALLGLADSPTTSLWIIGLYCGVQAVESYLVTPNVQKEAVSLPPALTISFQILFGVLFGIIGLAMATPLAAVALRLGDRFYVQGYLDHEKEAERRRDADGGTVAD